MKALNTFINEQNYDILGHELNVGDTVGFQSGGLNLYGEIESITDEERAKFTELLAAGFTDTFRYLYPDLTGAYSWWSYRFNARANNAGWRIDYFLTSNRLCGHIAATPIYSEVFGSDHCPIGLELKEESLQ